MFLTRYYISTWWFQKWDGTIITLMWRKMTFWIQGKVKCSLLIGTQPLPLPVLISCHIPLYRPGRRSLQLGLSGYYRYKWSSSVKPVSLIRAIKTRVQHRSPVKCVRLISFPVSFMQRFLSSLSSFPYLSLSLPPPLIFYLPYFQSSHHLPFTCSHPHPSN